MIIKRSWVLLIVNLITACYFLFLVSIDSGDGSGLKFGIADLAGLKSGTAARAVGELITIPLLITLIAGVYLSAREVLINKNKQRGVVFAAMVIGLSVLVFLIFKTTSEW